MIEITMTELALLIWAGVATSLWLSTREEVKRAKMFVRAMLENEELRNTVVADFNSKTQETVNVNQN